MVPSTNRILLLEKWDSIRRNSNLSQVKLKIAKGKDMKTNSSSRALSEAWDRLKDII